MPAKHERTRAYYFLPSSNLTYGNGQPAIAGKILSVEWAVNLREHGLYAFKDVLSALCRISGPVLCLVEIWGDLQEGENGILFGRHRKILKMRDISKELHEFSCQCAERSFMRERKEGRKPDLMALTAVKVKRKWGNGKATNEQLQKVREDVKAISPQSYSAYIAGFATHTTPTYVAHTTSEEVAKHAVACANPDVPSHLVDCYIDTTPAYAVEKEWQNKKLSKMIGDLAI